MKELIFTISLLNWLGFAWAGIYYFRIKKSSGMFMINLVKGLSVLTWVYGSILVLQTEKYQLLNSILAILIQLSSLALFWYSYRAVRTSKFSFAFTGEQPELLVTHGPYKYIRHPFYSAYILSYLSLFIFVTDLIMGVLVVVFFLLYARAARQEESKFAQSRLAEPYANYKRTTGMLMPRLLLLTRDNNSSKVS